MEWQVLAKQFRRCALSSHYVLYARIGGRQHHPQLGAPPHMPRPAPHRALTDLSRPPSPDLDIIVTSTFYATGRSVPRSHTLVGRPLRANTSFWDLVSLPSVPSEQKLPPVSFLSRSQRLRQSS